MRSWGQRRSYLEPVVILLCSHCAGDWFLEVGSWSLEWNYVSNRASIHFMCFSPFHPRITVDHKDLYSLASRKISTCSKPLLVCVARGNKPPSYRFREHLLHWRMRFQEPLESMLTLIDFRSCHTVSNTTKWETLEI